MNLSELTGGQRRVIVLLGTATVFVVAMFAGYVVASVRGASRSRSPVEPIDAAATSGPGRVDSGVGDERGEIRDIESQVLAARVYDQIAYQVELLRGLPALAGVPLSFLQRQEMKGFLREYRALGQKQREFSAYAESGIVSRLGSLEHLPDIDGLYVPQEEQVYVSVNWDESDRDAQAVLAHAHTHAIQDQHFDLEALSSRVDTADGRLAARALVEGDAILLTALYRYGGLDDVDWEHVTDLVAAVESPSWSQGAGDYDGLHGLELFPYWEGRRFVETLYRAGGWQAVNEAYANPPKSSQEILHPSRYGKDASTVLQVAVPGLGSVLGEHWHNRMTDTLGEVGLALYLGQCIPQGQAQDLAARWDGDTLSLWEDDTGSHTWVWRTVWDGIDSAALFEETLRELVHCRHPSARLVREEPGMTGLWWETNEGCLRTARVARYVTLAEASDSEVLNELAGVLP